MPTDPSVTTWIALLRDGEKAAAQQLWERYFARLVAVARGKLAGTARQAADEEDVALSAFYSFCRAADRFPVLNDRADLWCVLVMLTARKAHQERRRQLTQKRGGRPGEGITQPSDQDLDDIIGEEPTPEFAVQVAEQFDQLLTALPSDELRRIAKLRLDEHTNAEIASQLGCTERTVERKLALIRSYWESADKS